MHIACMKTNTCAHTHSSIRINTHLNVIRSHKHTQTTTGWFHVQIKMVMTIVLLH